MVAIQRSCLLLWVLVSGVGWLCRSVVPSWVSSCWFLIRDGSIGPLISDLELSLVMGWHQGFFHGYHCPSAIMDVDDGVYLESVAKA